MLGGVFRLISGNTTLPLLEEARRRRLHELSRKAEELDISENTVPPVVEEARRRRRKEVADATEEADRALFERKVLFSKTIAIRVNTKTRTLLDMKRFSPIFPCSVSKLHFWREVWTCLLRKIYNSYYIETNFLSC